jgi:hypothetical protein
MKERNDMKKLIGLTLLAALVAGFVYAQTTVTNRGEVITVYTMTDLHKSTETTPIVNVTVENLTQIDTAATTTATAYTPAFAGQILLGQTGAGTNSVWISKGTSTNDWVKVQ